MIYTRRRGLPVGWGIIPTARTGVPVGILVFIARRATLPVGGFLRPTRRALFPEGRLLLFFEEPPFFDREFFLDFTPDLLNLRLDDDETKDMFLYMYICDKM